MPDAPVRVLQVAKVTAQRLNHDGEGVASLHGMTLFIPNLLPGEMATVRVTAVEKRYARAVVLSHRDNEDSANTFTPAPMRSVPACPVFELCGGCQLQHMNYAQQLQHKRQVVVDALTRIGHLQGIEVQPTLGMETPWRYRNQVQVPLTYQPIGHRYTSGFFAASSHDVVPTDACHLISEALEETLRSVVAMLSSAARSAQADLFVHHLILRESYTTRRQMVVFVLLKELEHLPPELQSLFHEVAALDHVDTVAYTVQPRRGGPVWGRGVTIVSGSGYLTEKLHGVEYVISPRSFFQTNTQQASALYQVALEAASITTNNTVVDAYSGAGTMSLLFAKVARRVIGIEQVNPAVEDARKNAEHNQMDNVEFHRGDVERVLPRLVERGLRFDVAVVDPPRKGCDPTVLQTLLRPGVRPARIVYVSCNPSTLARDLRILVDGGYDVDLVQPVDMFPQTSHVECCVLLRKLL